jgi:hypothetical protein
MTSADARASLLLLSDFTEDGNVNGKSIPGLLFAFHVPVLPSDCPVPTVPHTTPAPEFLPPVLADQSLELPEVCLRTVVAAVRAKWIIVIVAGPWMSAITTRREAVNCLLLGFSPHSAFCVAVWPG